VICSRGALKLPQRQRDREKERRREGEKERRREGEKEGQGDR
jgi:hypothetical protein